MRAALPTPRRAPALAGALLLAVGLLALPLGSGSHTVPAAYTEDPCKPFGGPPENRCPVADAGDDQTVNELAVVTLNAVDSYDLDPEDELIFRWTLVSEVPDINGWPVGCPVKCDPPDWGVPIFGCLPGEDPWLCTFQAPYIPTGAIGETVITIDLAVYDRCVPAEDTGCLEPWDTPTAGESLHTHDQVRITVKNTNQPPQGFDGVFDVNPVRDPIIICSYNADPMLGNNPCQVSSPSTVCPYPMPNQVHPTDYDISEGFDAMVETAPPGLCTPDNVWFKLFALDDTTVVATVVFMEHEDSGEVLSVPLAKVNEGPFSAGTPWGIEQQSEWQGKLSLTDPRLKTGNYQVWATAYDAQGGTGQSSKEDLTITITGPDVEFPPWAGVVGVPAQKPALPTECFALVPGTPAATFIPPIELGPGQTIRLDLREDEEGNVLGLDWPGNDPEENPDHDQGIYPYDFLSTVTYQTCVLGTIQGQPVAIRGPIVELPTPYALRLASLNVGVQEVLFNVTDRDGKLSQLVVKLVTDESVPNVWVDPAYDPNYDGIPGRFIVLAKDALGVDATLQIPDADLDLETEGRQNRTTVASDDPDWALPVGDLSLAERWDIPVPLDPAAFDPSDPEQLLASLDGVRDFVFDSDGDGLADRWFAVLGPGSYDTGELLAIDCDKDKALDFVRDIDEDGKCTLGDDVVLFGAQQAVPGGSITTISRLRTENLPFLGDGGIADEGLEAFLSSGPSLTLFGWEFERSVLAPGQASLAGSWSLRLADDVDNALTLTGNLTTRRAYTDAAVVEAAVLNTQPILPGDTVKLQATVGQVASPLLADVAATVTDVPANVTFGAGEPQPVLLPENLMDWGAGPTVAVEFQAVYGPRVHRVPVVLEPDPDVMDVDDSNQRKTVAFEVYLGKVEFDGLGDDDLDIYVRADDKGRVLLKDGAVLLGPNGQITDTFDLREDAASEKAVYLFNVTRTVAEDGDVEEQVLELYWDPLARKDATPEFGAVEQPRPITVIKAEKADGKGKDSPGLGPLALLAALAALAAVAARRRG